MSSFNVTPELMAGFLDEAPEYLEMLDEGLLAFEAKAGSEPMSLEDPEDQERMNTMFRAAHSFKGLGAAMGFDKIRDLTHLMETLFDQLRMNKRALDPASIETLFGTFDKLRELVAELSEPPDEPVRIDDALAVLEQILSNPPQLASAPSSDAASAEAASPELPLQSDAVPPPTAGNESLADEHGEAGVDEPTEPVGAKSHTVLNDPELLQLFLDTTTETIEELNQGLLKLEEDPHNLDILNEVFRCAHNIKGATGAAGCDSLCKLTHNMETVFDLLRSEKAKLDDRLMNVILGAVDRLRADLELIRDGRLAELTYEGTQNLFDEWLGDSDPAVPPKVAASDSQPTPPETDSTVATADSPCESGEVIVRVTFPEAFIEAEIQAYLIYNKLGELGDVLRTHPDIDSMDGGSELTNVEYHLKTDRDAAGIEQIIRGYPVESVRVIGAGSASSADASCANVAATPAQGSEPQVATAPPSKPASEATPPKAATAPPPAKTAPKPSPVDSKKPVAPAAGKTAAKSDKNAPKVGETLRVDLERLDQLMNLGGELVINRARFSQIHAMFDPVFSRQNLGYIVDDITDRIDRISLDAAALNTTGPDRKVVADLSDKVLQLKHDFNTVRGAVRQVHEARSVMNEFSQALHSLTRLSDGIQKRIMETRMVSVGPLFQRFRRVVRDMAKATKKEVELVLRGEATELDKRMIDELGDPLTHMIRNSVDHGIETPDEREAAGKPRAAQVTLDAYHRGRHICIEVRDDGKGVDLEAVKRKILEREMATPAQVEQMSTKELVQYIFKPGFSTAEKVTDLSGRGMGMDIVMNKLEKINGTVDVDTTPGKGTVVTIKLPLTLAIITSLVARIGKSAYAIPLEMVAEIINVPRSSIQYIQKRAAIQVRDRVIPVALFEQIFGANVPELLTESRNDSDLTLVIMGFQDDHIGLVVDEMIGQEDVVIKNLATNYENVPGIAGASIMGDGSVSLILDVAAMMNMFIERSADVQFSPKELCETPSQAPADAPVVPGEAEDAKTGDDDVPAVDVAAPELVASA